MASCAVISLVSDTAFADVKARDKHIPNLAQLHECMGTSLLTLSEKPWFVVSLAEVWQCSGLITPDTISGATVATHLWVCNDKIASLIYR